MSGELGYFTLAVNDLHRAAAFFGSVLGWQVEVGEGDGAGYAHIANLTRPGGLHLIATDAEQRLYFEVSDIEAAIDQVRAAGGEPGDVIDSPSGRSANCTDNQGTRFSLWQAAPEYA